MLASQCQVRRWAENYLTKSARSFPFSASQHREGFFLKQFMSLVLPATAHRRGIWRTSRCFLAAIAALCPQHDSAP